MIRFGVSSLIHARLGTSLAFDLESGPEQLQGLRVAFLAGSVRVTRVQAGLLVQGLVHTEITLECVRCLDPYSFPLSVQISEVFRVPGMAVRPDSLHAVGDDDWLDLGPLLYEQIWLEVPIRPLCRSDCQGLCQNCGANLNVEVCDCEQLNIDPRLSVLRELLRRDQ
jgi:uncharacterized protein